MGLKKPSNDVEAVAPFVESVETRYCSDTHKTWHEIAPFIGKVVPELRSTAEMMNCSWLNTACSARLKQHFKAFVVRELKEEGM